MTSYVHRPPLSTLIPIQRSCPPSLSLADRWIFTAKVVCRRRVGGHFKCIISSPRLARDLPLKHRLCMHLELEEKVSNSYNLNSANSETVLLPIFAFEGNAKAQVWERRDFFCCRSTFLLINRSALRSKAIHHRRRFLSDRNPEPPQTDKTNEERVGLRRARPFASLRV